MEHLKKLGLSIPNLVPRVVSSSESAQIPMDGLGDVIARMTRAVGIKPCGGCKQRQEALNKLVPFENKETNGNQ
jgi:hypothetical protein